MPDPNKQGVHSPPPKVYYGGITPPIWLKLVTESNEVKVTEHRIGMVINAKKNANESATI